MSDPLTRLNSALESRYRVEREIGSGGMATVYLADDLRHERKVALKVLRPELAAIVGAERFVAEIRTTANLQHPHILPLFDSGQADGFLWYAMPYVEGESLRDWLDREKQLPVDEAVAIAIKVARALQAAHGHSVIHRDVKPANILLQDGEPLVADFGIALAVREAGHGRLTDTGLSLGTPHYMSPEQATGERAVGPTTDIYALGCVLYEMLVGQPPYTGSTAQAVLGKVIVGEAESVRAQRRSVPANVEAAIAKALEKLPADRFLRAEDFARALEDPGFRHGTGGDSVSLARDARRASVPLVAAVLAAVATFALGIATGGLPERGTASNVARFTLSPTDAPVPNQEGGSPWGPPLVLSPDGSSLVYVRAEEASRRLYVRRLSQLGADAIPGTEDASAPFFSPGGGSIGFLAGNVIKTVPVTGGPATEVTDSSLWAGADWAPNGYIYFTHARTLGLARVPQAGGPIEFLTEPDTARGELSHLWPDVLPDGQGVLFSIRRASLAASEIASVSLRDQQVRSLGSGVLARYARTGHLLSVTAAGQMMITPFDVSHLAAAGGPVAFAEGLRIVQYQSPGVALSDNGTLVYLTGATTWGQTLVWVGRDGTELPARLFEPSDFEDLAFSPDGDRLALTVEVEEGRMGALRRTDVYVVDRRGGRTYRLTSEGTNERPFWTPDGTRVTFLSRREGRWSFYWRAWDASEDSLELLFSPEGDPYGGVWTPDGQGLVYSERSPGGNLDISYAEPGSRSTPVRLLASDYHERSPVVSPDGDLVAFTSDESGRDEVYVMPLRDPRNARRVSRDGGNEPRWAHAGDELFFRNRTAGMFKVDVRTAPVLSISPPESLFPELPLRFEPHRNHTTYEIDSDDGRFLMIRQRDPSEEAFVVILNFFDLLEREARDD